MIDELCNRIWKRDEFQNEKNQLILGGLKYSLSGQYPEDCLSTLPRLIQCASHFALSNNPDYRKTAYDIAINSWKLCNSRFAKHEITTNQAANAISLILTRLGNFPADSFLKEQVPDKLFSDFPVPLWMEQEFHRDENTVCVSTDKKITLTDFQCELWQALENYPIVAVNAPTSAGKSFALQHYLVTLFVNGNISRAVYLVPTRALISQVHGDITNVIRHDLSLDISISEVPQDINPEEKILFVLTQERLQILLDQNELRLDFLIVDEAQTIRDNSRGVILQSVVERVREKNPGIGILFGSPFTQNPDIFAQTFGIAPEDYKIIATEESPVSQNLIHIATDKYKPQNVIVSKISEDITQHDLIKLDIGTELVRDDHTLSQLSFYFGSESLNIVYGSEPVKCEKIAGLINEIIIFNQDEMEQDEDLEEFSALIKEHIHKEFYLSEYIKNGVAYHYGNLPAFLRKGLEYLCSVGKISFIVCTSTLLQGVNLPAQNIFIMKPSKGVDIPLTPTDFWNLSGRAGRLKKDFEGNIYLINLNDWAENPLGKNKQQRVVPSFTNYICKRTDELLGFINANDHPSGVQATEGFENTFMKLYSDYLHDRIDEVLSRYKDSLSNDKADEIINVIKFAADQITIPLEITDRNPNISVFRQQDMLNYLIQRIKNKGPEYVIPPHPAHEFNKIKQDYIRFFRRMHTYFQKLPGTNRSHLYYYSLSLLWMRGMSYFELLKNRIEWEKKNRKTGTPSPNTEARNLFREIESELRFRYVKFTRCYNDLLSYALTCTNNTDFLKSIPPIHLFLELGASSRTMMSLIGLGLTRTGASIISNHAPRTDMDRENTFNWLNKTNLSTKDIPMSTIREVDGIIAK